MFIINKIDMSKPTKEELKAAFDELDVDSSGSLEFKDLKTLVTKFDIKDVDDDALKKIIEAVDTSGDGKVSFEEFCTAALG